MCNVHFILTLTPSMTAGQGHEILRFCELFLLTGSSLCSLLLRNYLTDFSNDDTNQLRHSVQRALHFDLDPSMTAGQGREILRFWEFRCLTGSSLCSLLLRNYSTDFSPMMISINSGNNVDVQHALHFHLHPSMTAGQGHKILQFCEFRLLPWHECWYMLGPYKVAGDRLDLVVFVYPV